MEEPLTEIVQTKILTIRPVLLEAILHLVTCHVLLQALGIIPVPHQPLRKVNVQRGITALQDPPLPRKIFVPLGAIVLREQAALVPVPEDIRAPLEAQAPLLV